MKISFRPYQRRDGSWMVYVNRSNGVSLGISSDRGFRPYGKGATPGMRNAMEAAEAVFAANAQPFTGDLGRPEEGTTVSHLADGWVVALTDVGSVGGMNVGSDGAYVIRGGRILRCGTYDEE